MKLPDEPRGWSRLQALAQQAPDAQTLAQVIDEMNRLLDKHEQLGGMSDSYGNQGMELQLEPKTFLI